MENIEKYSNARKAWREIDPNDKVAFVAGVMQDLFNSYDSNKKKRELANEIYTKHHPTAIQIEMGFAVELIKLMATGYHDGRTKASNALAKKFLAAVDEQDLYLPMR